MIGKDTVILDLEKYNELRDFCDNVNKNNTIIIGSYYTSYGNIYTKKSDNYISKEETVLEISKINKNLLNKIDELETEINLLKFPSTKEITIEDVKKYSIWKFLKWRKIK